MYKVCGVKKTRKYFFSFCADMKTFRQNKTRNKHRLYTRPYGDFIISFQKKFIRKKKKVEN